MQNLKQKLMSVQILFLWLYLPSDSHGEIWDSAVITMTISSRGIPEYWLAGSQEGLLRVKLMFGNDT